MYSRLATHSNIHYTQTGKQNVINEIIQYVLGWSAIQQRLFDTGIWTNGKIESATKNIKYIFLFYSHWFSPFLSLTNIIFTSLGILI